MVAKYNKALVALGTLVITVAGLFGTDIDPEVVASITTSLGAILVLLIPNAKPVREVYNTELDWAKV